MLIVGEVTAAGIGTIMAGLVGVAALIESVRKWVVRNNQASVRTLEVVEGITSSLNHLDEPLGQHPTIGQMIGRIDARVDRVETKIDGLHDDVRSLSNAMLAHITDEGHRTHTLEEKVHRLERALPEAPNGQGITH